MAFPNHDDPSNSHWECSVNSNVLQQQGETMKKLNVLLIFTLVLSGCASYVWKHPHHNSQAQLQRDEYECERDRDMRLAGYGRMDSLERGFTGSQLLKDCFRSKGYYRVQE
jgi:hypothetical protein